MSRMMSFSFFFLTIKLITNLFLNLKYFIKPVDKHPDCDFVFLFDL